MKLSRIILLSIYLLAGKAFAQPFFPGHFFSTYRYINPAMPLAAADSSGAIVKKKWTLQSYSSLSAGMMFWKGGSASFISAPMGLQLTRPLSNNVFAFAGVSIAPAVIGLQNSFSNTTLKNNGLQGMNRQYQFGGFSRAELGLGYTNDARTFQITGSIGIQQSTYPFSPAFVPVGSSRQAVPFR